MIISALVIWIGVMWAFVAVMHCKKIAETEELTLFWKVHIYPLAGIGLVLDFLFNYTFGWLAFMEWPWAGGVEPLFTARVQRHYDHSMGWRADLADWIAIQLNQIDPRHIK